MLKIIITIWDNRWLEPSMSQTINLSSIHSSSSTKIFGFTTFFWLLVQFLERVRSADSLWSISVLSTFERVGCTITNHTKINFKMRYGIIHNITYWLIFRLKGIRPYSKNKTWELELKSNSSEILPLYC